MNGLCGLCGDPYDQRPRPHEAGGKYAKGIVTETFLQGQIINVKIEVTANHGGVFAFRLCPLLWYMGEANEPCFERNQLRLVDGSSKFIIPPPAVARVYSIPLVLPQGVICTRCVIQWTWTTGEEQQWIITLTLGFICHITNCSRYKFQKSPETNPFRKWMLWKLSTSKHVMCSPIINIFRLPPNKLKSVALRPVFKSAPALRNDPPYIMKYTDNVDTFKSRLKTHVF